VIRWFVRTMLARWGLVALPAKHFQQARYSAILATYTLQEPGRVVDRQRSVKRWACMDRLRLYVAGTANDLTAGVTAGQSFLETGKLP